MTRTTGVLLATALGTVLLAACGDDPSAPAPVDELSGAAPYDAAKLRAIATEDFAESAGAAIRDLRAAGVVVSGRSTVVTRAVTVTGGRATVEACVDDGTTSRTHQGTPVPNPPDATVFSSTMVREVGVWKVDEIRNGQERC
jgi:hypothetical protein